MDPSSPLAFGNKAGWLAWLEQHGCERSEIWVKFAKKDSGIATVSYAEAVEAALCHGWIDGQSKGLDEDWYLQRFTPRRPRSRWSKLNRARAEALIVRGEMRPAGLREVERARADGRWEAAYDSPSTATVPDDLQRELDRNEAARTFFAALDGRNRYAILHGIQGVKRPETRARRIERIVAMLSAGERIHP